MKKQLGIVFLMMTVLALCLTACASISKNKESPRESSIFQIAEVKNCRITRDTADVKSGAGESFNTIGNLKKGDEVSVLGQIGEWYVIQLDNNQVGCVNSADATPIVKEGEQRPNEATNRGVPQTEQPITPDAPRNNQQEIEEPDNLSTLERQMVEQVNEERRKNQLPLLKTDLEVTRVARIKSQDMVDNNYFSHYSPNYGSPFEMLNSFGIEYLQAGENIAANSSVREAHEGLMNSSGHRKNILNPNFTHIGIGIRPSQRHGYIITQLFIGR